MKRFIAGVLLALAAVLIYRSCRQESERESVLQEQSRLIQKQVEQVSKLIVTEGHFAEVFTYEDSRELFGSLLSARKRALVVVNARATVAYDLGGLTYRLDPETRTLHLLHIPDPEIVIVPDIEYYDVTADFLNPFEAEDYNAIKDRVTERIRSQVETSTLRSNAQNRLLSELAEFWVLTRSMGWQLTYQERALDSLPGPGILQ